MRIFHPVQIVDANRLYIPFAMRAALGWLDNQVLYCWARDAKEGGPRNQISIAATEPSEQRVWKLSAGFADRPGLVAQLARLLTDDGIEILTLRASTFRQNTNVGVEMQLDARNYAKKRDKDLRGLQARIVSAFVNDMLFEPDGRPQLEIVANRELGESGPPQFREPTLLSARQVTIPAVLLERATDDLRRRHRLPSKAALFAAVVGDTEVGAIDVTFFHAHTGYKHVRLQTKNQPGALATITDLLSKHGFDILQAYHRVVGRLDRCVTDLLVRYRVGPDDLMTDHDVMTLLRRTMVPAGQRLDLTLIEPQICNVPEQSGFWREQMSERPIPLPQPVAGPAPPAPIAPFKVFVSYSKTHRKYFKALKSELEAQKMDVITGFEPDPNATEIKDTIRARVDECAAYVGILTPDSEAVPSQWIFVEEGIAIALSKPYVLMIHEKVMKDSWSRVDATRQNYPFTERNYKKVAKLVCQRMQAIRTVTARAGS